MEELGERGEGGMMNTVIEAAKGGLYWLLWQGLLTCSVVSQCFISGSRMDPDP